MRDHYEGTPLAIDSTDIGGGIWQMPYRPTPLTYTVDGNTYFNERPISTQQSGFSFVSQMRSGCHVRLEECCGSVTMMRI